ncbi:MAG: hypothetical protein V4633_04230 [Pseudomonadota bacterium]
MIFFLSIGAAQLVWDWGGRERTMWTLGVGCLFVFVLIMHEARRPDPTDFLELADGIMIQRHNGIENVIQLAEVTEATILSILGNNSIFLKLGRARFIYELDPYSADAAKDFELVLGPKLKRGGIATYLKLALF